MRSRTEATAGERQVLIFRFISVQTDRTGLTEEPSD